MWRSISLVCIKWSTLWEFHNYLFMNNSILCWIEQCSVLLAKQKWYSVLHLSVLSQDYITGQDEIWFFLWSFNVLRPNYIWLKPLNVPAVAPHARKLPRLHCVCIKAVKLPRLHCVCIKAAKLPRPHCVWIKVVKLLRLHCH